MRNVMIIFGLLLYTYPLIAQKTFLKEFYSDELKTNRTLKIHVPASYRENPDNNYPLAIVLDAEYLFDIYLGNMKLFSQTDKAPEQIVVGVFQNYGDQRSLDCEYSTSHNLPEGSSLQFYNFIKFELLPSLEEAYRLSHFKTILGNSLTANFINYFLIDSTPSFNAYISINPQFAPNMPVLFQKRVPQLNDDDYFFYLNSGKHQKKEDLELITQIDKILSSANNTNFNYHLDTFDNSTAIASIGQSISGAFAHIFKIYAAISEQEFEKNIKHLSPPDAIAYLENKYLDIEYLFEGNFKIRQRDIFMVENVILDKENGDYLKDFGKMINKLYPNEPMGDYYIGRYYELGKSFRRALQYYKNGFSKIPENTLNADRYYENIERVLQKSRGNYVEEN